MKKINSILNEALEKIRFSNEEFKEIENLIKDFLGKLNKRIKELNIDGEAFVGGSFAKNTAIKKNYYDIDVFVRFNKKYKSDEISELLEKAVKIFKNLKSVHGSRDYFRIEIKPLVFLEVIPVIKIKNPREAENITDLSYSHVNYVNKKIPKKILDEIRFAKAFCHANNCYGAESYIHGFSGYSLELLVYHYKSFLRFITAMTKIKDDKLIIDIEKHFKNKNDVLRDLNSSKLQSPIILIDPTFKNRNTLAALSNETFEKFKETCRKFLKNPTINSFESQKVDLNKIKNSAGKKNHEFILLEIKTNKQEGDIAGSKLLKFYHHLDSEIEKLFVVKDKGFEYNEKKSAMCFFAVKSKKEILIQGPEIKDKKNILKFKKRHKKTFEKKRRIYACEKIKFGIKEFIKNWKDKNKIKIKEMDVEEVKVVN